MQNISNSSLFSEYSFFAICTNKANQFLQILQYLAPNMNYCGITSINVFLLSLLVIRTKLLRELKLGSDKAFQIIYIKTLIICYKLQSE